MVNPLCYVLCIYYIYFISSNKYIAHKWVNHLVISQIMII